MLYRFLIGKNALVWSPGGRSTVNTQQQDATMAAKEEPEVSTSMCDGTMKRATEPVNEFSKRRSLEEIIDVCVPLWNLRLSLRIRSAARGTASLWW